jgi:hypothetical protein
MQLLPDARSLPARPAGLWRSTLSECFPPSPIPQAAREPPLHHHPRRWFLAALPLHSTANAPSRGDHLAPAANQAACHCLLRDEARVLRGGCYGFRPRVGKLVTSRAFPVVARASACRAALWSWSPSANLLRTSSSRGRHPAPTLALSQWRSGEELRFEVPIDPWRPLVVRQPYRPKAAAAAGPGGTLRRPSSQREPRSKVVTNASIAVRAAQLAARLPESGLRR